MDIQQLNRDFGIAGQLEIISGQGGLPMIKIDNDSASALISIYGGQVLSFQPLDQAEDVLFLSQQSAYTEGKAIRGGIPVCWPWFGPDPKGLQRPNHGFVRNHFWQLANTTTISASETKVSLLFNETYKKENTWRQPFMLLLDIGIGPSLQLKLTTFNTGDTPFSITQAFHSYFRVGDIKRVKIFGLEDCEYFDKLEQGTQKTQKGVVAVTKEVDRVYVEARRDLVIVDPVLQRRIHINSPDTSTAVVWNPWSKTSKKMPDLANLDYRRFICVEAGNVAFDLIKIQPGSQFSLQANYSLRPD
ncbi:D-hexose-6-phosphate mutarotase [Methylomonas sp. SURF-2]|uniref:Putative glucose-6-phosphate 1-epimerase n=1 Tax=Methylomonas subterranea TaxID=2952225 RepID=A0ABT1TF00_9GAMM|nr:D-hexose-6-phosphate mutarotase [Methylomonas sp. SURF-2]MCQ8104046.1 D-hexose-6-phosphate mutarotase [Methylomonas sp. SURF-2]